MLPAGDLARIAELCNAIGNDVTDDSGFIPVRDLLSRFHAQLLIRPLLVEAMLASREHPPNATNASRWMVLVDSEKYPYSQYDVDEERNTRQLPRRMRNTIAHELVHSLAFRSSEFGIRLKARTDTSESLRDFVEAIEAETERLSPLLLWSEKAIGMLLRGRKDSLSLSDLLAVIERTGISRYVLVNRLLLIRPATDSNGFLFSAGLRNLAVGLGVWGAKHSSIKGWPLFWNFDDGFVPSFLLKIPGHEHVPSHALISDQAFALLGGVNNVTAFETNAGTRAVPAATNIRVEVSVEEVLRRPGEEFLFVVRKVGHL